MKGSNGYSRSTTKKAIDTEKDSYLSKAVSGGSGVCVKCSAIYKNKRWALPKEGSAVDATLKKLTCPACQKIKDGFAGGYVTLKGDFLKEHRDEIMNLVKNKEARAMNNNPLERIIDIKNVGDSIEITTTTDKFAQMLGRIIHKAFSGTIEYKWSDDVKIARVLWQR